MEKIAAEFKRLSYEDELIYMLIERVNFLIDEVEFLKKELQTKERKQVRYGGGMI
jgi:hypothetical protein